jgi:hypothetical protein
MPEMERAAGVVFQPVQFFERDLVEMESSPGTGGLQACLGVLKRKE